MVEQRFRKAWVRSSILRGGSFLLHFYFFFRCDKLK
jgi:hypothetical protein